MCNELRFIRVERYRIDLNAHGYGLVRMISYLPCCFSSFYRRFRTQCRSVTFNLRQTPRKSTTTLRFSTGVAHYHRVCTEYRSLRFVQDTDYSLTDADMPVFGNHKSFILVFHHFLWPSDRSSKRAESVMLTSPAFWLWAKLCPPTLL